MKVRMNSKDLSKKKKKHARSNEKENMYDELNEISKKRYEAEEAKTNQLTYSSNQSNTNLISKLNLESISNKNIADYNKEKSKHKTKESENIYQGWTDDLNNDEEDYLNRKLSPPKFSKIEYERFYLKTRSAVQKDTEWVVNPEWHVNTEVNSKNSSKKDHKSSKSNMYNLEKKKKNYENEYSSKNREKSEDKFMCCFSPVKITEYKNAGKKVGTTNCNGTDVNYQTRKDNGQCFQESQIEIFDGIDNLKKTLPDRFASKYNPRLKEIISDIQEIDNDLTELANIQQQKNKKSQTQVFHRSSKKTPSIAENQDVFYSDDEIEKNSPKLKSCFNDSKLFDETRYDRYDHLIADYSRFKLKQLRNTKNTSLNNSQSSTVLSCFKEIKQQENFHKKKNDNITFENSNKNDPPLCNEFEKAVNQFDNYQNLNSQKRKNILSNIQKQQNFKDLFAFQPKKDSKFYQLSNKVLKLK